MYNMTTYEFVIGAKDRSNYPKILTPGHSFVLLSHDFPSLLSFHNCS